MGQILNLHCDGCDYAEIDLAIGTSEVSETDLRLCPSCRRIVPALVDYQRGSFLGSRLARELERCPHCHGDELTAIDELTPCPRCLGNLDCEVVGHWT